MSRDPLALDRSSTRASRLLVFAPDAAGSALARALAGAGYRIDTVTRTADLSGRLDPPGHDVIVLDLSAKGASGRRGVATVVEALGALEKTAAGSRPTLVIATTAGAPIEGISLQVDAWVPGREVDLALREVRAAIAIRSLERVMAENEGLRGAVLFARHTAHELAQPLTTVLARAQLLLGNLRPDHPHYRAVSVICAEAERLALTAEEFNKLKEMIPPREPSET